MKDIPGFGRKYVASEEGKLFKRVKNDSFIPIREYNNKGYLVSTLWFEGTIKNVSIHRMIATTFISNPLNLPQVNHINGKKTDNRVPNLEWCTAKENVIHAHKIGIAFVPQGEKHGMSKLSKDKILLARNLRKEGLKLKEIGNIIGTSFRNVSLIVNHKAWKHIV